MVGLIGTAIVVFLIVIFLYEGCIGDDCISNLEALYTAEPNAVGDTLAGLAGSLALFWIIITAWNQSIELREQREVILQQKDEIAQQREATQRMADALTIQSSIFQLEQKEREEARTDRTLVSLDKKMMHQIFELAFETTTMWKASSYIIQTSDYGTKDTGIIEQHEKERARHNPDEFTKSLKKTHQRLADVSDKLVKKPPIPSLLIDLLATISEIDETRPRASPMYRITDRHEERLRLQSSLRAFLAEDDFWASES